MDITKLAEYGITGIAIAIIIGFTLLFKYLLDFINRQRCDYLGEMEKMENRHVKTYNKLGKSIDKNSCVTQQTYEYLKLRNGSIEKAIANARMIIGKEGERGETGKKGDKGDKGDSNV